MHPEEKEILHGSDIDIINPDASMLLNTLKVSDLKSQLDVIVCPDHAKILKVEGVDRHISVSIPGHFRNQAGIIEDRIKFGMTLAAQTAKYGVIFDDKNEPYASLKAYSAGKKASQSIEKMLENTGCIILQEA